MTSLRAFGRTTLALLAAASLSSCIIVDVYSAEDDGHHTHHSINGDLEVGAGERRGDLSSINGDLSLGPDAQADDLETVNGDIHLMSNARANDIENVNGDVQLDRGATVLGDIHKTNGDLRSEGARVAGDIHQANGDMRLHDSTVNGDIIITNVDLGLEGKSRIMGDVLIKNARGETRGALPHVALGPEVQIDGSLILEREVRLSRDPQAQIAGIEYRYR